MKKVLVHVCCADCGLKMLRAVGNEMEVTVYYYNPNIQPRAEYLARLAAVQKMIKNKIVVADWRPKEYFEAIKSKKKPGRCMGCWRLRLEQTAKYAKEKGFDEFGSTLISSQYQDGEKIKKIGREMEKKYGVKFWIPEVVDKELKSSEFYKQFFCGCAYSLEERYKEKYQ